MSKERINPQSQEDESVENNENREDINNEPFESDTQKIMRRHLENKDDIITDEDIANIRVGMVPPEFDRATESRFEGDEAREEVENEITGETKEINKDENLDEGQITPWDTIDGGK
ncbi:MAG TPA: hypothetical protein VL095_12220 [Flavisolibacter sp.]|nr:hypothetical protein [Flavisolibacter sp.]